MKWGCHHFNYQIVQIKPPICQCLCERNSVVYFFKLAPICSGHSRHSSLTFWHLPCSYIFARGNCILLGGSFYISFHAPPPLFPLVMIMLVPSHTKKHLQAAAGSHKWLNFPDIQNVLVRSESWWTVPVRMLPLLAGGKGGELHKCFWNTPILYHNVIWWFVVVSPLFETEWEASGWLSSCYQPNATRASRNSILISIWSAQWHNARDYGSCRKPHSNGGIEMLEW